MATKPRRRRIEKRREKRALTLAKRKLAEQRRRYAPDDDKVELQRRFSKYAYEPDLEIVQDQIKIKDEIQAIEIEKKKKEETLIEKGVNEKR